MSPERGGFCRQIMPLALFSWVSSKPSLFVMKTDRIKTLIFHIENDDYFGTLSTILDLLRQDSRGNKYISNKNIILRNISDDLMYLQDNYKIVKK